MDAKNFVAKKEAYDGFVKYRKSIMDSAERGKFDDVFADICTKAIDGDCIAQDCVAYFYNKGKPGFLKINYDLYMSWEILAGANGNCFALDKLEFFLKYATDIIFEEDEVLKHALFVGTINADNALYVISNLLCESMADILELDTKTLVVQDEVYVPFSQETHRKYVLALENSIPIVLTYLAS